MIERGELASKVVELLLHRGRITRAMALEHYAVRPALLSEVVARLKQGGLVLEPQRSGRHTGRKASSIVLNPAFGMFWGVELGITAVTAVAIDMQGSVLASAESALPAGVDKAAAQEKMQDTIHRLSAQLPDGAPPLRGVGFADPGLVSVAQGLSIKAVNVPGWENLPTAQWLADLFKVPAQVLAAPSARAYAEYLAAGSSAGGLFHMQLDEAIGGGFIKNGQLFAGDNDCAMEIGHIVVQEGGPICQCGNRGCLEAVAGLRGLERRVQELAQHGVDTSLTSEPFTLERLVMGIAAGDKASLMLASEVAHAVGVALAACVSILNPATVVFSGTLASMKSVLIEGVRRTLVLHCLPQATSVLQLQVSQLKHGTPLGAALLSRQATAHSAARQAYV